ncbi:MAG: hypothetical protein IPM59_00335 [Chloracidobacterium sp.]|nr:hypothetical protein [Chloracidobacterium sp.]
MAEDIEIEDPYADGDFLPLRSDEQWFKYEMLSLVYALTVDTSRSPEELKNLAIVRLALERLPRTTPAVHMEMGIVLENGGEMSYTNLSISEERMSISVGGYVRGDFGGDSYSTTLFECESNGFRDGSLDPYEIGSWQAQTQELINLGARLSLGDCGEESEIEWESEFDEDQFEVLEEKIQRWEEQT